MIIDNPERYIVQTLPVSDRGAAMQRRILFIRKPVSSRSTIQPVIKKSTRAGHTKVARAGAFNSVSRSPIQARKLTAYLFFSCSYRSLARRVPSAKSFLAFSGKVRLRAA